MFEPWDVVLAHIPARVMSAAATPFDVASWFAASVPAGALINGLGLGALAVLFATDRILTKGQHLRRVQDLQAHYDQRIVELKSAHDARIADLQTEKTRQAEQYQGTVTRLIGERDYERQAKDVERGRADALVSKVTELAQEFGATTVHLLKALDVPMGPGTP